MVCHCNPCRLDRNHDHWIEWGICRGGIWIWEADRAVDLLGGDMRNERLWTDLAS